MIKSAEETIPQDELARRLAEYDELAVSGFDSVVAAETLSLSNVPEFDSSLACLDLLEREWPRRQSAGACTVAGRFQLERVLGEGGAGIVYLARDLQLKRRVAIKILNDEGIDPAALARRLLREARFAAALEHPHILEVFQSGIDQGRHFMVTGWCAGGNLAEWMRSRAAAIPIEMAIDLMLQLVNAVQFAHSRGILHYDLKPANVLVHSGDSAGFSTGKEIIDRRSLPADGARSVADSAPTLKIADFGLARSLLASQQSSSLAAAEGTIGYMAPEQILGDHAAIGPHTDVYSLGAILFELLTGKPPFEGLGVVERIRRANKPPRAGSLRRLPRAVEMICYKSLAGDLRRRYGSTTELLDDLQRFRSGQRIRADRMRRLVPPLAPGKRLLAGLVLAVAAVGAIVVFAYRNDTNQSPAERDIVRFRGASESPPVESTPSGVSAAERERPENKIEHELRLRQYINNVGFADTELLGGRPEEARILLRNHLPTDEFLEDLRGPEWHTLWRMSAPAEPLVTARHGVQKILSAAFSPDESLVATGDWIGTIAVFSVKSGEKIEQWKAHQQEVRGLQFSPDGTVLASGGGFEDLRIWDVATWKERNRFWAQDGTIQSIDFSPDGNRLATGGRDHFARIWNWRTGEKLAEIKTSEVIYRVRWGSDTTLLTSDALEVLRWNIATGEAQSITPESNRSASTAVSGIRKFDVARDGKGALFSGYNIPMIIVDLASGKRRFVGLRDCSAAVISRNAAWMAYQPSGHPVSLFKLGTPLYELCERFQFRAHLGETTALEFSERERLLVTGSDDGEVKIWDLNRLPLPLQTTCQPTTKRVIASAYTPDSRRFVAVTSDGRLTSYDLIRNSIESMPGDPISLRRAVWRTDAKSVLGQTVDDQFVERTIESSWMPARIPAEVRPEYFTCSEDGSHWAMLSSSAEGAGMALELFRLDGNQMTPTMRGRRLCRQLRFGPEGRYLAAALVGPGLSLFDCVNQTEKDFPELNEPVSCFAFDPNGARLAATGKTMVIRTLSLDAETVETLHPEFFGYEINSLAFSPTAPFLAIALTRSTGENGKLQWPSLLVLWHCNYDRPLLTLPCDSELREVSFSPNGRYVSGVLSLEQEHPWAGVIVWDLGTEWSSGIEAADSGS